MIVSKAELSYVDFLVVMGPIIIVTVFVAVLWLIFGRTMTVVPYLREAMLSLSPQEDSIPLWWALALGAGLEGETGRSSARVPTS